MVKFSNYLIQKPDKTNFNNLPEEIMFEIFTRLPAESVLDCKSVCKTWKDLVSQQSFSQIHFNHHLLPSAANFGKPSFVFLYNPTPGLPEFYYAEYDETLLSRKTTRIDMNLRSNFIYFMGSSNGLICFGTSNMDYSGAFYICNPITREYVFLPKNERNYRWSGFGYVHSTNEYKVVRMCLENRVGSNVTAVQVYTLGSGNGWRDVGTTDISMRSMSQVGVFANEALHWADSRGTIILAFYLADEKISELPAPPPPFAPERVVYFYIGVLGDFVSATYCNNAGKCDIWLWKKNDDNDRFSWKKEFSFKLSAGIHHPHPFVFTENGRLLYYQCGNRNIYSYDPKSSTAVKDHMPFVKHIHNVIPHKNTLVSLKVLGEKDTKTMKCVKRTGSSEKTENSGSDAETMDSGKRASSSEETENCDKLKKPQLKVRDRVEGFYAMGVKKFRVAIQKLLLPKCC